MDQRRLAGRRRGRSGPGRLSSIPPGGREPGPDRAAEAEQLAAALTRSTHRRVLLEPSSTAPVGPLPAQQRTGLAAQRLLSDRTEAERAFQLAERLGSVNAAAAELGTTWPSLRKAFTRHGLGMPTPNPEAVRQRVIEAARQRSPRPATPSLDPVFVALNQGELPVRARSGGELAERVRWAEDYAALGAGVVVEQHSESTPASPAPAPGRSPATPSVATATRPTAKARRPPPWGPRRPHRPIPPTREGDGCRCSAARRFRADLVAHLTACRSTSWPTCSASCPTASSRWGLACRWWALNERLPDADKLLQRRAARPGRGAAPLATGADRRPPGARRHANRAGS